MLNEMQSRNYRRCQRLQVFLNNNTTVYSSYIPFNKEKQSFDENLNLFKTYVLQKHTDGTVITRGQKELKDDIASQLANICDTATAYAVQYNNAQLAAVVQCTRSDVKKLKDADVYTQASAVVNALLPLINDAEFIEYNITESMLNEVLANAATFRDNIGKGTVEESNGTIANQKINEVIKLLNKNIQAFSRLINRFATTNPDFVNGFRINAALESAATRHTGIEGTVTAAATGKPIADAVVAIAGKDKNAVTNSTGSYSIISMYGGDYELTVSATGFTTQTVPVRVSRGKTAQVNIEL